MWHFIGWSQAGSGAISVNGKLDALCSTTMRGKRRTRSRHSLESLPVDDNVRTQEPVSSGKIPVVDRKFPWCYRAHMWVNLLSHAGSCSSTSDVTRWRLPVEMVNFDTSVDKVTKTLHLIITKTCRVSFVCNSNRYGKLRQNRLASRVLMRYFLLLRFCLIFLGVTPKSNRTT